jgi:hypothetical protein
MSNSTFIRPALKTRVQAPVLFFYGCKRVDGDRSPYSQPVKQKISVLQVVNKGTDLFRHICARKKRVLAYFHMQMNIQTQHILHQYISETNKIIVQRIKQISSKLLQQFLNQITTIVRIK